ncbi:hypothetical protein [Calothrix sp. PCC 7507]|uniref:hypothetical protein n=1 Tax=Calothrix sp. PCC 7507 TaxID=99598 RepID=UPI00029EE29E|nr:hypothetical protein [Calothrix sp. PCC 7507]AFY34449.1 hypothetical protein Cal7507_4065 [Calothrix sp. PCC 7507]
MLFGNKNAIELFEQELNVVAGGINSLESPYTLPSSDIFKKLPEIQFPNFGDVANPSPLPPSVSDDVIAL